MRTMSSEKAKEKDAFLETFLETNEEVNTRDRKHEHDGTLSTNSRRFKTLTVYFCMFCHVRSYNVIHSQEQQKVVIQFNKSAVIAQKKY